MSTDTIRLRELTLRYIVKRDADGCTMHVGRRIRAARDAAEILMPLLEHQPSEVFGVLYVTTRRDVIAYHEIGRGALDSVIVEPREVFRGAILVNAAALILAHNHPSGDATASADDVALTRRLIQGGALLGLDILDHLVIGDHRHTSLQELGRM